MSTSINPTVLESLNRVLKDTPYSNPNHPLCIAVALVARGEDQMHQLKDELTKVDSNYHMEVSLLLAAYLGKSNDRPHDEAMFYMGFLEAQFYEKDPRLAAIDDHHAAVVAGDIPRTS